MLFFHKAFNFFHTTYFVPFFPPQHLLGSPHLYTPLTLCFVYIFLKKTTKPSKWKTKYTKTQWNKAKSPHKQEKNGVCFVLSNYSRAQGQPWSWYPHSIKENWLFNPCFAHPLFCISVLIDVSACHHYVWALRICGGECIPSTRAGVLYNQNNKLYSDAPPVWFFMPIIWTVEVNILWEPHSIFTLFTTLKTFINVHKNIC